MRAGSDCDISLYIKNPLSQHNFYIKTPQTYIISILKRHKFHIKASNNLHNFYIKISHNVHIKTRHNLHHFFSFVSLRISHLVLNRFRHTIELIIFKVRSFFVNLNRVQLYFYRHISAYNIYICYSLHVSANIFLTWDFLRSILYSVVWSIYLSGRMWNKVTF